MKVVQNALCKNNEYTISASTIERKLDHAKSEEIKSAWPLINALGRRIIK